MSSCFYIGNSTYRYDEPFNFDEALRNLDNILEDGLVMMRNLLEARRTALRNGKAEGFLCIDDYDLYVKCQQQMKTIESRKAPSTLQSSN